MGLTSFSFSSSFKAWALMAARDRFYSKSSWLMVVLLILKNKSGEIATTQQTAKPTMVWAEQPSVPPPSLKNLIQRKQCPEEELGISQPRSGDRKRQIIVFVTVASSGPQLHTCSTTEVPLEPTLKICLDSHFKTIF